MASGVTDARKRDVIGDCPIPRDYDAAPRGRLAAEDCRVGRRLRGPGFVHECEPARSPGGGRRTALSIDAGADVDAGPAFDRFASRDAQRSDQRFGSFAELCGREKCARIGYCSAEQDADERQCNHQLDEREAGTIFRAACSAWTCRMVDVCHRWAFFVMRRS